MQKKSIKKSTIALGLGIILGSSVITGCSLVTTNYEKYNNATAALISFQDGSEIKITRKDLRSAYAQYSFSQYVQAGYYTEEEALEKTMDFLVSQKLAVRDAEVKSRAQNANNQVLTAKEKTFLWEKTVDAMLNNINSYANNSTTNEEKSTPEGAITREKYERKAELIFDESSGLYYLQLPESAKKEIDKHQFRNTSFNKDIANENDKKEIYTAIVNYITDNQVAKNAYQEYLSALKSSEKNLKLSQDVESIFEREIDRVYGILYDSYMVEKYNDFISSSTTNNVIISSMLDLYASKVRTDYTKYRYVDDQTEDVKKGIRDCYYFNNDNVKWFTVSHILVKFSDIEQEEFDSYTQAIDNIEKGIETEVANKEYYQNKIDALYENLKSIKRTETKENVFEDKGDEGINAADLLKEVNNQINGKSEYEKAETFADMTYIYNEDTGLFSSNYNYIVGVDYSKPSETYGNCTAYSNWVEDFNKAAIELYDHGNGEIGDVYSSVIKTNYGLHIMMYTGEVDNLFTNIDSKFTLQNNDIKVLYDTRLNAGTEKTYFDLMYEQCIPKTSSIFEQLDIDRLKGETTKINYYPDSF